MGVMETNAVSGFPAAAWSIVAPYPGSAALLQPLHPLVDRAGRQPVAWPRSV